MSNPPSKGTALITGASSGASAPSMPTVSPSVATTSFWWPGTRRGCSPFRHLWRARRDGPPRCSAPTSPTPMPLRLHSSRVARARSSTSDRWWASHPRRSTACVARRKPMSLRSAIRCSTGSPIEASASRRCSRPRRRPRPGNAPACHTRTCPRRSSCRRNWLRFPASMMETNGPVSRPRAAPSRTCSAIPCRRPDIGRR